MAATLETLEELEEKYALPASRACRSRTIVRSLLPCETHVQGTETWAANFNVDSELAHEFKVLDLISILKLVHPKRTKGLPAPRFAMFNVALKERAFACYRQSSGSNPNFGTAGFPQAVESHFSDLATVRADGAINRWAVAVLICVIGFIGSLCLGHKAWSLLWFIPGLCSAGWAVAWLSSWTVDMTANLSGLIPSAVRDKIVDCQDRKLFENIFLVQDVAIWNATTTYAGDPLVVGLKEGVYYLIDRFDTTTMEEYVAKEFTADLSNFSPIYLKRPCEGLLEVGLCGYNWSDSPTTYTKESWWIDLCPNSSAKSSRASLQPPYSYSRLIGRDGVQPSGKKS